jgi:hypothetical protein
MAAATIAMGAEPEFYRTLRTIFAEHVQANRQIYTDAHQRNSSDYRYRFGLS